LCFHFNRRQITVIYRCDFNWKKSDSYDNTWLSYRRETALQGGLFMAKSGRLELGDNILRTL